MARISQSQKEETCLVTVYSHKLDQRVGLIVESACVNARTLIVTQECYYRVSLKKGNIAIVV